MKLLGSTAFKNGCSIATVTFSFSSFTNRNTHYNFLKLCNDEYSAKWKDFEQSQLELPLQVLLGDRHFQNVLDIFRIFRHSYINLTF